MQNFEFHNPTRIVFGTETISKLDTLLPESARVLILYGGASAKANGELPANLDDKRYLNAIFMMADGFFCRRATDPNFDPHDAADTLFAAMRGLATVLIMPESGGTT